MTGTASRQLRSARNALCEALGLGETYPLRDLPVRVEPPVAAFGSLARVSIEDSEREVLYRLMGQDGQPLPGGAKPQGTGTGAEITIDSPPIAEDIRFTLEAKRPSGRAALLFGSAEVRVGLDASLAVTTVPPGPGPIVIDHGASLDVEIVNSQEGVTYRLVGRPADDQAAADDVAAMANDVALGSGPEVPGTGTAIRLASIGLDEDVVVHVRALKVFGGAKPPQTTLLKAVLPVFVRPDAGLAVSAKPAIVDHGGKAAVRIAKAEPGIAYALHSRPVADSEFVHSDSPGPSALTVPTPGGDVHILVPPPPDVFEEPEGFAPLGDPATGSGGTLALPVPGLVRDSIIVVEARKTHVADPAFTSAERLDQAVAVLVRPDPGPPLRLTASLADGKLTRLSAVGGEEGVFYSLAQGGSLGELYLHQHDPADPALNKGVGALAIGVDFVIAAGAGAASTSAAPPPLPVLDLKPLELPAELAISARRATTGLTADLGKLKIAAVPAAEPQPASVAAGKSAKIRIADPVAGERYSLAVDGRAVAAPVEAGGAPLSLGTGPLMPGQSVELLVASGAASDAIQVERRVPLAVSIG